LSKLDELQRGKVEGDFYLDGYLILRSVFDANEINNIYNTIRQDEFETLSKIKKLLKIDSFDKSAVAIEKNSFKYLKYANFWFQDISKLINLSLITKVGKLIGENNYITGLELHQKFPGVSGTPPHQDNFYFGFDLEKNIALTAYIALNEQTKGQGGLGFYPGSHFKVFDHHKSDATGFSSGIDKVDLKNLEFYTPHFYPGDVVLHHCNIVHEAKVNSSSQIRSNIAIRFYPLNPQYDEEIKRKYRDFLSQSSRFS
jgi:ectoine hydroxylase-related dioxygenase (phytanoyl-CoA dioxygenase family)